MASVAKVATGLGVAVLVFVAGILGYFLYLSSKTEVRVPAGPLPNIRSTETRSDSFTVVSDNSGVAHEIVIDFSRCSPGRADVPFGLGSAHFLFEGISGNACIFNFGQEIENPRWGGSLPTLCHVPVTVGSRTFVVAEEGIRFDRFLSTYCTWLGEEVL